MRNKLLNSLLAASLATLTVSALAENATPREPTPGQANPITGTTQNGSPVGTTPSTAPMSPGMNSQGTRARMTNEQVRAYMDARQACSTQTGAQMQTCTDEANRKFSSVDPKCQKVSGPALADCLKGADHGG
ncbi:MAG: hypothetical protein ABI981_02885 [Betaproteobacteria bacterium]